MMKTRNGLHPHEIASQAGRLQTILLHLQFEGKPSFGKNLKQAKEVLPYFDSLKKHMEEEEEILFPFLESRLPRLDPFLSLLRSERRNFNNNFRRFKSLLGYLAKGKNGSTRILPIKNLREAGFYLIYFLQGPHREEKKILYRIAKRELRADERKELAGQFRQARRWT